MSVHVSVAKREVGPLTSPLRSDPALPNAGPDGAYLSPAWTGPVWAVGLTSSAGQANINRSMHRQPTRRASRFLAGGLAFALSIVSSSVCVAAILQMEDTQQHTSCASMVHESDSPKTTQLDCCIAQSAQFAGLAPDSDAPVVAPPVVMSLVDATPQALVPALRALSALVADVPKPSSTPTYLLVSVFRL